MKFKLLTLAAMLFSTSAFADGVHSNTIKATQLTPNVHLLEGQGGNIAVIENADALTVVDTQFAKDFDDIKSAIGKISPKSVRYVINTHGHNDHTNGNEAFVNAFNATIIAHHNTTELVKAYNQTAAKPNTLPHLTFEKSFTFQQDEPINLHYFANAHTNGDVIVHLSKANVIHAGDILFFGRFPFIDVKNGGTIDGMIGGLNGIVELADENTKIIAGHGNVASKAELQAHIQMLSTIKDRVATLKKAGKSLADIQASHPAKEWEASHNWNFINHTKLVESVYQSLP
ncbi:MBL fold metallo-hydrolase [Mannheimia sp. E30BD]|uniref:MBL fold metallo-hydrolase n=1 Tax=Mannheimia sp. E30BD TaxID=3278708 RepID=UPI00359E94F0